MTVNPHFGKMKRTFAIAAAAALTLSACSGLKDALSAHTYRVARVESAELSATRLATLLGKSRAPIRKDIGKSIANLIAEPFAPSSTPNNKPGIAATLTHFSPATGIPPISLFREATVFCVAGTPCSRVTRKITPIAALWAHSISPASNFAFWALTPP